MSLKVYNTLIGKKEEFIPIKEGKVGMYVCGPTVYDTSHIGHARSVVVFDTIFRWLTKLGFDVRYVRNFTDVDDKIIKKSNQTGQDCSVITEKYIDEFHNEMDALNVLRPVVEPKATENIPHIIDFIQMLIDRGKAYHVDGGDVYFSIDSFKTYGKLSGRNPDDMRAGARIAVDEKKKNPLDFTLWKPAKPDEPFWESPWGEGRPGWHIECSAMSYEYLGESFDIHGGGKDLIFPHHENEIAQSEAVFGVQFVKYWIHNGFVDINNEKMSKSLGNFTMIKEVLAAYSPEVIRMFLLSNHYRSPIDYSEDSMREISLGLDRIYAFLERLENAGVKVDASQKGELWKEFSLAMNDDFNSAKALGLIFESVKKGNRLLDETGDTPKDDILKTLVLFYNDIKAIAHILGIFLLSPSSYFKFKKDKGMTAMAIDPSEIEDLIQQRAKARKNKNFSRADEIRDLLQAKNITLEDGPEGTTWRFE
ncbi:MAG: cysteine--tRNA ligase [Desulfobacula sp.]|uniref:cysteine--tRNA ligase n=1 Tax=Desulfobacula sp. TaxID=2593537 RepID=UPI001DE18219|nr:cysteine--tRNA ligase [Desulfobacula sp.]MBT3484865.1 cysteine--tRNA ligase [Desulfobacula sp.]MBT3804665.1 cysteine--tRNA ligase [Desulfobacula sp.]MBT4024015.1 cysteine--tRNA ligase [Desulfobacula sp.]MBT4198377.1 cysteine--tRNA ligase [Desulfobacula sp.]